MSKPGYHCHVTLVDRLHFIYRLLKNWINSSSFETRSGLRMYGSSHVLILHIIASFTSELSGSLLAGHRTLIKPAGFSTGVRRGPRGLYF